MKRYILIVAAAAIAAVSCSRNYDVNPTGEGAEIGFGTWAENLTKAISDPRTPGSNEFGVGDSFAVYGYKETSSGKSTVFDDVAVEMTVAGTPQTWTYSPTRYWDPASTSYTFFAVSPAAIGTAATVNAETGEITSASITFAGNDNDILVADKKEVTPTGTPAVYAASPVELVFNHIASLVDFKVDKDANLGNATLAIKSFSISNIDKIGTFGVSDAYTSSHPVVTWNCDNSAVANLGTYTNTSGVTSVATLPTNVASISGAEFLINHLVAMPQTFRTTGNKQTVNIEYTITDEASNVSTYTKSFDLKLFDDVDDRDNEDTIIAGWEAGKHYTFIITIDANKIDFSAKITNWTTETGYNYLLN